MTQLVCNSKYLDMYRDTKIAFAKSNILFGFDDIQCERTQSFDLPDTPTNDAFFRMAKLPANDGSMVREKHEAQLIVDGCTKDGMLYITAYDVRKHAYKAVFVCGELIGLLNIKNAGKLTDLAEFGEVVTWKYGTVPNLPARAGNGWDIVKYQQYGEFVHPSYLLSYVINKIVQAQGLPTIYLPDSANLLRVIVGKLKPISKGRVTINRMVDNYFEDVTKVFPYPLVTNAEIVGDVGVQDTFTLASYPVTYRDHRREYDGSMTNIVYGGQVEHLVATQTIDITFDKSWPYDMYIGTFANGGSYKGDFEFYGDRSFAKAFNYAIGVPVTTRSGEELAGRTVRIEAGKSFTLIRESDLLDYTKYTEDEQSDYGWAQGWRDVRSDMSHEVTIEGVEVVNGSAVRLKDNLAEITLVDLLKAIAVMTGTVLNYTTDRGVTFDSLYISQWPTMQLTDVIEVVDVERTFSDYAQRNVVSFDSDETVRSGSIIETIYQILNQGIDKQKNLLKVPFSEGNSFGSMVMVEAENEKDTIANASTPETGMVRVGLPVNDYIKALCDDSTKVTIKARMPLVKYEQISTRICVIYNGSRYVWTESTWSDGVATLKLNKITF